MINWKIRYAKIIEKNPDLFDEKFSILEVGSGNFGIAEFLQRKIVGLEPEFFGEVGKLIEPITGSILKNDFKDGQFDYVICVDVLEHLNSIDRKKAIEEMLRISKKKVLISFPCGEIAMWGDKNYSTQLQGYGIPLPPWLRQHIENGFPLLSEVAKIIKQCGYKFELIGNEGMMQHYGGIFLDHFFGASGQLLKIHSHKVINQAPIIDSEWDLYYSFLFSIDVISAPSKAKQESSVELNIVPTDTNLKIYSVFHIPIPLGHLYDLSPLAVGGNVDLINESQYLSDVLKDGGSLNNARWSELSGIYKVWKENPSSYVGFSHYRRIFDLRLIDFSEKRYTSIPLEKLPKESTLFGNSFLSLLDEDTIFLPKPEVLNKSIFDDYHFSHKINDLCIVYAILQENFPELSGSISIIFDSSELYANNMFITSWKNFDEICQIWFSVLKIFEGLVVSNSQNRYQARDISFLAERIFTIWIHYKKSQGIKLFNLPFFFIEYPDLDTSEWTPVRN